MRFTNRKTDYRGETYDSGDEAYRASQLELLRLAGKIVWWRRGEKQMLIDLGPGKRVTYRPDFLIEDAAGKRWAEDVKGKGQDKTGRRVMVTREFRIKALLWEQRFPNLPLRVVDREGEVIWPKQREPRRTSCTSPRSTRARTVRATSAASGTFISTRG